MTRSVRAVRAATTFEHDDVDHVTERVVEMVTTTLERNGIGHDDIVSILFTATDDLTSVFPAGATRTIGLGDVPLICARELAITGSMPRCIRMMMHVETPRSRAELRHVYLHEARSLRDDLPE
ncbi:MAG: chorismate mutase [Microthrixaceae bacterium]